MSHQQRDVVIVGGGLAGLTLALQLKSRRQELDIAVLERQSHPVPVAAHKVGESTVEIGAHYLSRTIGLEDHLKQQQLPKFGLRFFFGGNGKDFSQRDEMGINQPLAIQSYQLDRGILENELGSRALAAGIDFRPATPVMGVQVDASGHTLRYRDGQQERQITGRWLVDAASRTSPLKRSLGLARSNDHDVNAAWFRVEGRINVDDWSGDADWQSRCQKTRWLSTNHLMGPGYWVWLIPLSSGTTSIGIVADQALHPLDSYNSLEKAHAWLARHEPRCLEGLADAKTLDFRFLKHFSHDCSQVYSPDRWALSGEAGVFLDPFYSPGSDFIAISNSFISELILAESRGENISRRSRVFQHLYYSFYSSTMALYQDLYPGFGDRDLMVLKTLWDYSFYWSILAQLFFSGGLVDEQVLLSAGPDMQQAQAINTRLQALFQARGQQRIQLPGRGVFINHRNIPCLKRFNGELADPVNGADFPRRVQRNVALLKDIAGCIEQRLANPNSPAADLETDLFGDLAARLNG